MFQRPSALTQVGGDPGSTLRGIQRAIYLKQEPQRRAESASLAGSAGTGGRTDNKAHCESSRLQAWSMLTFYRQHLRAILCQTYACTKSI